MHLCLTTSPLSPSPPRQDKCTTCQIGLCTVGQRDQKETQTGSNLLSIFHHAHRRKPLFNLYLYVYLLIDPICAYLISPFIFLSQTISPSLSLCLSLSGQTHRGVMDRDLHSIYSISLITLSLVGRPINALTQIDPATLTANAPAS